MDLYHYLFKFIIVGDTSVGKSCLLLNYTEGKFKEEHDATIGVEFGSQGFKHKNKQFKIQIWDTAGQESFRSITRSYYKGSIGVLLVFDITNRQSFHNIVRWYNEILDCAHESVDIVIVGNKIDLESERQVSADEGKQFAEQYRIHYIETSAKTGQFVDQVFQQMAMRIHDKIENKLIDQNNENLGIKLGTFYRNDEEDDKELQTSLGQKKKKKNDDCC
ncbi:unnamed protein product (macronuclear) [Paramecium tetraurelia]|uniref:Chromosome undetermined scaffold_79, whole genome shotgun sequence n=1 Tax=Paramecium tetraurelia TaxID=5888 RepID=Q3SDJ2_PARTE|nr:uncharacterized protein GSPATT00023606001 [Paramecium tetraurelia]CAI39366.1 rab_A31 [Paramecium tetraurelia]CAK90429.1 unnamed protein product [Paramecium tetraurelia]|eukprot:XP_001457826.1 hypothetical protein (macronuclear) [Paramecium tetraurelia strain d4-2]